MLREFTVAEQRFQAVMVVIGDGGAGPDLGEELRIDRRVAAFVVLRTLMLEAQHRASTLS